MSNKKLQEGEKFGEWTVIRFSGIGKAGDYVYEVRCSCGTLREVKGFTIKCGYSTKCNICAGKKTGDRFRTHGMSSTKTHRSWKAMKARCLNKANQDYALYGGRGITVCERWKNSFPNFLEDMGERPKGMTLDRINNDGNYEPSNCKWSTQAEQVRNSRLSKLCVQSVKEIRKALMSGVPRSKLAEEYGVNVTTIRSIAIGETWKGVE